VGSNGEQQSFTFRVLLTPKIYRTFEISGASSLYALAEAITLFFDFDFDHAFGFYSKLTGNIYDSPIQYMSSLSISERARRRTKRQADTIDRRLSVGREQDEIPLQLWRRMRVSGRPRQTTAEGT
jgi:hypothetical protein